MRIEIFSILFFSDTCTKSVVTEYLVKNKCYGEKHVTSSSPCHDVMTRYDHFDFGLYPLQVIASLLMIGGQLIKPILRYNMCGQARR